MESEWSALCPGCFGLVKTPCHPFNKRLSGLLEPVCMLEEEKILLLLFGIAPLFLCCPTHNLVTKTD